MIKKKIPSLAEESYVDHNWYKIQSWSIQEPVAAYGLDSCWKCRNYVLILKLRVEMSKLLIADKVCGDRFGLAAGGLVWGNMHYKM